MNSKRIFFAVLLFMVCTATSQTVKLAAAEPDPNNLKIKPLCCAFGSVGVKPVPTPPTFETQFAVVVVEIKSPSDISNVVVTDFELVDKDGKMTNFKRVVEAEIFERPRVASEGELAYYLNTGGTRPWSGTLPAGTIRLRIKFALSEDPGAPVHFRLTIGRQVVEGPVNFCWPT